MLKWRLPVEAEQVAQKKCRVALFPNRNGVYCLVPAPPLPPFCLQNLENKRVKFRLWARSLSLEELHAKSREHGSYGGCEAVGPVRFGTASWNWGLDIGRRRIGCFPRGWADSSLGQPKKRRTAWLRLSKIEYYLVDNVSRLRLSDVKHSVNGKARLGSGSPKGGTAAALPRTIRGVSLDTTPQPKVRHRRFGMRVYTCGVSAVRFPAVPVVPPELPDDMSANSAESRTTEPDRKRGFTI
jgi:hypothetical protein